MFVPVLFSFLIFNFVCVLSVCVCVFVLIVGLITVSMPVSVFSHIPFHVCVRVRIYFHAPFLVHEFSSYVPAVKPSSQIP